MPERLVSPAKEIEWAELLETALTVPGSMGGTYNRFYNYSFLNQIILAQQGVREPVATYKRWQTLGRQVIKGSKAKAILRPIAYKYQNELGQDEMRVRGFKYVNCLFTVSETEGDDLPPYEPPTWSKERALARLAITQVPFELMDGNVQGYSIGREIAVSPVARYPEKTLFHEFGHVVLGHTADEFEHEYQLHRGLFEFQAEGTALLTANELEMADHMDMAETRAYIQTWLQGEVPPALAIRQIFTGVDKILKAGREEPAEEE
ncbi:ArdC-like ssDNA-binding domain-containing protein [Antrihabitans sp. YC2-6]|uniref:ArdC-like ssDNA-binding domain-containing protein n=1 Tax=Antrihabitans sp. YC2-6 TaxID=2799498 RepID=UPI0018F3B8DA|nr:ArdC-like ssDNA-binding domain-containing protein [Antrihabitans sp. YC2-6]MBJ8343955.1 hypothetical protein [Antrihabitans sp. YC2-6]